MTRCLICERPVQTRGLCRSHYRQTLRDVQAGRTTWALLECVGLARPPANQGENIKRFFRRVVA